jgi:hypothetical protein
MATMPTIPIAINVSFQRLLCTLSLLTPAGGEYGHYANDPHCYKCKLTVTSSELILINGNGTARRPLGPLRKRLRDVRRGASGSYWSYNRYILETQQERRLFPSVS